MAISKISPRRNTSILILFLALAMTTVAQVPAPNQADPVSDAFHQVSFILNLNPVVWSQVRTNFVIIADQLRRYDPKAADELISNLDHIIIAASRPIPPPNDDDMPPNPEIVEESGRLPRTEGARQCYEQIVRAVGIISLRHLQDAFGPAAELNAAHLAEARSALAPFEDTLRIADPPEFNLIERALHELDDMARPTATKPPSPASLHRVRELRDLITRYLSINFGNGFNAPSDRPLAPWPRASATYNPNAHMPVTPPPGSHIAKPSPRPRQILNSVERGANERETPLISFGASVFNNPTIFGEPARAFGISCNTCHSKGGINADFFIPGLSIRPGGIDVTNSFFAPHANNGVFDPRDIPDLRGIRFTAPYGRNGRFASLRDFVRNVIVNEFNGDEPDPLLLDSVVAYMDEFDFLKNPALNGDGRLNHRASEEARRGEKIFNKPFPQMNNASCASCHIPSANFVDHLIHDIGSLKGSGDFSRDRALDTPTLLGIAYTAPYFHDGSLPTLQSVVEWFDREYKLGLTTTELADLSAYLLTIGNGIHAIENPGELLATELEDQESFLSSFEFLAEKGKWNLVSDLFRGVALDLRELKATLKSSASIPVIERLALLMDEALAASAAGIAESAHVKVRQWREFFRAHRHEIK